MGLGMLIAYNEAGDVVGTLDYLVQLDENLEPVGLVDFLAAEALGIENTELWRIEPAAGDPDQTPRCKGSKAWPEWLGGRAHEFRVELDGPSGGKHIASLVHKASGHRRERAAIEAAIAGRIVGAKGKPADIRDIVGGPNRPLSLDEEGRNRPPVAAKKSKLPVVRRKGEIE